MKKKVEIRRLSRLSGVTELARRLGLSKGHVSLVLNGRREASPRLAARLRRLGVEPAAPRGKAVAE